MSATEKVMKWCEDQQIPPDRRRAPLRKVIRELQNAAGSWMEVLECGHQQHKRSDYIGHTNAIRRRCLKCAKETGVVNEGK